MWCCASDESREQRRIDKAINEQIQRDKRYARKEIKLLLMGTGESGKSTFIKQMRIIHGKGFNVEDRKKFKELVFQNIFMGIQSLANAMEPLGLDGHMPSDLKAKIKRLNEIEYRTVKELTDEFAQIIADLWQDPIIQSCYKRRNEFQLSDSAAFFLNSLSRVTDPEYIPTEMDVLRVRVPTSGIHEYCFELENKLYFRMVDVGGQRSERRKWLHSFENVTSIIFLVAISEYDQKLMECAVENRLAESRNLFFRLVSFKWFQQASIILFLNKTDLLEEKVLHSDIADYFPTFKGQRRNADDAKNFIRSMFMDDDEMSSKNIYTYFTCATGKKDMLMIVAIGGGEIVFNQN